jgi:hypothetical protein
LICNGFKPESIGATLHVSRAMVNSHLQDLYHTFHVESRDELIRTAFAIQLVTDKDLIFYDRGKKIGPLPEWAAAKLKMKMRRY